MPSFDSSLYVIPNEFKKEQKQKENQKPKKKSPRPKDSKTN